MSKVGEPLTKENKESLHKYLELTKKYFDLKFSEAMFAGGILQISFIAIKLYSQNSLVPSSCDPLVKSGKNKIIKSAIPFCIGRECHGIPSGLLVYAGRNQFNHWDGDEPHEVPKNVFNALSVAFMNNMWAD